jgi:hypothetical protein
MTLIISIVSTIAALPFSMTSTESRWATCLAFPSGSEGEITKDSLRTTKLEKVEWMARLWAGSCLKLMVVPFSLQ